MDTHSRSALLRGLLGLDPGSYSGARPPAGADVPSTIPDPRTGQPLAVASVEVSDRSVCPSCAQLGAGAYVSFVAGLRLAFACSSCRRLVFTAGT